MKKVVIASLALINGFFFLFEIISKRLNGFGIDDSIFYHLFNMGHGAAYGDFWKEIAIGFVGILALILIILLCLKRFSQGPSSLALIAALIIATPLNDGISKTFQYTVLQDAQSRKLGDSVFLHNEIAKVDNPRNLVYLYLESVENTYTNEKVFPGLTPNINQLKKEAFTLENAWMPKGTGWTIAGMVGSQCGAPLVVDNHESSNSFTKIKNFMPNATCMGDYLSRAAYSTHYFGGADITFGAKDRFYRDHGFANINGINELEKTHPINKKSPWGVYDEDLFGIIKSEVSKIKTSQSPYALFALNLDTHHPFGHMSPSCQGMKYGDGQINILNAVHCTDALIGDLVRYIRAEDPNAVIVLSSDHLAMPNDAFEILEKQDRRNLFMVLGKDIQPQQVTEKTSTFDFGATALSFAGFDINGIGWGRNLVKQQSIIAQFDNQSKFDDDVSQLRKFHRALWSKEKFEGMAQIGGNTSLFKVAGQDLEAPFAISFDANKDVSHLLLNGDLLNLVFEYVDDDKNNLVYIDQCVNFAKHGLKNEGSVISQGLCYLISISGAPMDRYGVVNENFAVDKDFTPTVDFDEFKTIFSRKDEVINFGMAKADLQRFEAAGTDSEVELVGGPSNDSKVRWNGQQLKLGRGISFFGVEANGKVSKIAHKDFCDGAESIEVPETLKHALAWTGTYKYVIYAVDDSPFCGKEVFDQFAKQLPYPLALGNLEARQPIFAMVSTDRETFVKAGPEGRVTVRAAQ